MKPIETVLDYILNTATDAEFEVIVKACERRRRDAKMFSKMGGMNPEKMAKNLSSEISQSMGASMESLRSMVKGYVGEIILKNAPEITEDQLATLLDEYVPEGGIGKPAPPSTIPPDVMITMVRHFVRYSSGAMSPSEQQQLWEQMPRWYEHYWTQFPSEIKTLIDAYLHQRIDEETCFGAIMSILGI